MFNYQPPVGGPYDWVSVSENGDLKFEPRVYEQRYATAIKVLEDPMWTHHLKKVVDFGCSEMKFLRLLRKVETIEHIMEVDTDEQPLVSYKHRAKPLFLDYLQRRSYPLRIEIWCGSAADSVENLRNVDAVVALELIEHLEEDVLEKVPSNVFGFIQPKVAIFSTPNREYNVLFKGLPANGLRVADHKFEWTRKEFQQWAENICEKYPNYTVSYIGVGSPPPNRRDVGHVTQMAIFARKDIIGEMLVTPINPNLPADQRPDVQYKEIYTVDYPYHVDKRTILQKIKDEITGYLSEAQSIEGYHNPERNVYLIPLDPIIEHAKTIDGTEEDVVKAVQELDFQIESGCIILTGEYVEQNYRHFFNLYDEEDDKAYEPYGPQSAKSQKAESGSESMLAPEENWG